MVASEDCPGVQDRHWIPRNQLQNVRSCLSVYIRPATCRPKLQSHLTLREGVLQFLPRCACVSNLINTSNSISTSTSTITSTSISSVFNLI